MKKGGSFIYIIKKVIRYDIYRKQAQTVTD